MAVKYELLDQTDYEFIVSSMMQNDEEAPQGLMGRLRASLDELTADLRNQDQRANSFPHISSPRAPFKASESLAVWARNVKDLEVEVTDADLASCPF